MIGAPPPPSWRKPAGVFAMIGIIVALCVIVIVAARWLAAWPIWAQALVYVGLGIAWILPLGPLLHWMQSGPSRERTLHE